MFVLVLYMTFPFGFVYGDDMGKQQNITAKIPVTGNPLKGLITKICNITNCQRPCQLSSWKMLQFFPFFNNIVSCNLQQGRGFLKILRDLDFRSEKTIHIYM